MRNNFGENRQIGVCRALSIKEDIDNFEFIEVKI